MVIGAAVVLFIASFLDLSGFDCPAGLNCSSYETPNAWDALGVLMSVFLAGIIGAALVVVGRAMPGRKVVGLDLGQFGAAFCVFALWTAFWTTIDAGDAGTGLILGLLAAIVLAGGAVATPLVPALKAPLVGAPRPQAVQPPYGGQPQPGQGYGYPGAQQQPYGAQPGQPQPYGAQPQPGQPDPAMAHAPQASRPRRAARRRRVTSRRSGSRCRWPVRCTARTVRRARSPNWRRAPGTSRWSSAVRGSSPRPRTAVAVCFRTPRASSAADHSPFLPAPRPFRAGGRCRTLRPCGLI